MSAAMEFPEEIYQGLQGHTEWGGCIHGTALYNLCGKCVIEGRERERHEMLRQSFERLTAVLEKLEAKL